MTHTPCVLPVEDHADNPAARVVSLSARGERSVVEQILAAGFDAHLTRRFSLDAFSHEFLQGMPARGGAQ